MQAQAMPCLSDCVQRTRCTGRYTDVYPYPRRDRKAGCQGIYRTLSTRQRLVFRRPRRHYGQSTEGGRRNGQQPADMKKAG